MQHIIPDPDFEGFDGNFVDNSIWNAPPNQYKLSEVANYLCETEKDFKDLSDEELENFKFMD